MFGTADLRQVTRHQEALRRDAADRRLAATTNAKETSRDRALRVLRLRPSLAA